MQKISFTNSRRLKLVGHYYEVGSDTTVVMVHGLRGDKSFHGKFDALARQYNAEGYNAFAFDFCGSGESDVDSVCVEKQLDDLRAAIQFVKNQGSKRLVLNGHSLGAYVCLRAYTPEVSTMVLFGALTGPIHFNWRLFLSGRQRQELEATGRITIPIGIGFRKTLVVEEEVIKEVERIDAHQLFGTIACPLLIVHGNADPIEKMFLKNTRQAMAYLPPGSKVAVIDGASHGFCRHIDLLTDLSSSWLRERLSVERIGAR